MLKKIYFMFGISYKVPTTEGSGPNDLLDIAGANPDAVDLSDGTPLHDAAWAGHHAVAQVLLVSGASVNAKDAKGVGFHWFQRCSTSLQVLNHVEGNQRSSII